jgi:FKBP-type peptidyl-prolyl cis-trans isomerase FkpA
MAEITNVQNYLQNHSLAATQHCSGLFYRIENAGSGAAPGPCSDVTITYNTYFFNGTVIEQQASPTGVSLGISIGAIRIAIPLIKAGGRIVFYVPPSLAYGAQDVTDQNGNVIIPANSYLVYEINLISVQ